MIIDIKKEILDFGKGIGRFSECCYIDELTGTFASFAIDNELDPILLYTEIISTIPKTESLALVYCELVKDLLKANFYKDIGLKIAHENLAIISEGCTDGYLGMLGILARYRSDVESNLLVEISKRENNPKAQNWAKRILMLMENREIRFFYDA